MARSSMVRVVALYAKGYWFKSNLANKRKIVILSNGNPEVFPIKIGTSASFKYWFESNSRNNDGLAQLVKSITLIP
jgi:hypothetical protein